MFTRLFLKDLGERAVKSFAGGLLSYLTVAGVTVLNLAWLPALASAATAALLSVLLSVVSLPVGRNGTASLVGSITTGHRGRHEAPEG